MLHPAGFFLKEQSAREGTSRMDESKVFVNILLTPNTVLRSRIDKEDKNDDKMKPTNIPAAKYIGDPVRCRVLEMIGAMNGLLCCCIADAQICGVKKSEELMYMMVR